MLFKTACKILQTYINFITWIKSFYSRSDLSQLFACALVLPDALIHEKRENFFFYLSSSSGNSDTALLAKLHLGQGHVTSKKNITCELVWKWGALWACPTCACTLTVWSTTNSALDKYFPQTRAGQCKVVTLTYSRVTKSPTFPLWLQISLVQLIKANIPSAQTDREGMKCCHTSPVLRVNNLCPVPLNLADPSYHLSSKSYYILNKIMHMLFKFRCNIWFNEWFYLPLSFSEWLRNKLHEEVIHFWWGSFVLI